MKKIKSIFVFIILTINVLAQENVLEKAPKQYSVEFGYKNIFSSNFDNRATEGYCVLLDYAWQLSGFVNKHKVYLSVPFGYSYIIPDVLTDKSMSILNYGWTVRHELSKNKKNTPFIGYALLLNQLRIDEIEGSIFGHQTKFDFGYNFRSDKKIKYFAKLEYSFTRFPTLGVKKSNIIQTVELKIGLRF